MTAAQLIEQTRISNVWAALGGGELRRGRAVAFYRGGDDYNVALNDKIGAWRDFVTGDHGGILDLIIHVRGGSRGEAARWLADMRGVTLDNSPWSQEDRRRYAERRRVASVTAGDIAHWRDVLIPELNARKLAAVEAGDFKALGPAAKLCHVLECGSPEEIAREFIKHRARNPKDTERLITEGRERDLEAQRTTAECVLLLASAAEREGLDAAA
jgi:hypothetical protein